MARIRFRNLSANANALKHKNKSRKPVTPMTSMRCIDKPMQTRMANTKRGEHKARSSFLLEVIGNNCKELERVAESMPVGTMLLMWCNPVRFSSQDESAGLTLGLSIVEDMDLPH